MGWAQGFESGTNIARNLIGVYQNAKQQQELEKVSNETPENSTGFTPEQGDDLRAAAESGQYDVAFDESKKAYTVTPKADPTQVGVIAQQGVTDFLGKRSTSMSDAQVDSARQRAMAGVIMKSDPVTGARMMRDLKQGENDDQRFVWDKARNEREIRQGDQAEKDQQTMRDVDAKTADWFKGKLANPDGTQRAATIDDHLAASQFRAGALTEAGKVGEAGKVMAEHNSQSLIKIQLEGAQRDQDLGKTAAALNAGDLGAVKDFYNKYVPDGAKVTNVTRGSNGQISIERESLDGQKMPPTVLKDTGQMAAALSSFKDPMALYQWSQNEFRNNLALRQDSREGARLGLAQEAASTGKKDTEALRDAGVAYEKARQTGDNEGMKAATLALIQAGGVSPGAANANAPAEVKLAQAMVQAGMAPDMRTGLEMAISKKGMSGDEIHNGFVSAGIKNMSSAADSVTKADEAMKAMGYTKSNGRWSASQPAAAAKPANESDAQSQAKAAIAGGADKGKVNDRLKSMGFKPID